MELREYLFRTEQTVKDFAKKCGVSQPTINKIKKRDKTPTLEIALRVSMETESIVTPIDMLGKDDEKRLEEWKEKRFKG